MLRLMLQTVSEGQDGPLLRLLWDIFITHLKFTFFLLLVCCLLLFSLVPFPYGVLCISVSVSVPSHQSIISIRAAGESSSSIRGCYGLNVCRCVWHAGIVLTHSASVESSSALHRLTRSHTHTHRMWPHRFRRNSREHVWRTTCSLLLVLYASDAPKSFQTRGEMGDLLSRVDSIGSDVAELFPYKIYTVLERGA